MHFVLHVSSVPLSWCHTGGLRCSHLREYERVLFGLVRRQYLLLLWGLLCAKLRNPVVRLDRAKSSRGAQPSMLGASNFAYTLTCCISLALGRQFSLLSVLQSPAVVFLPESVFLQVVRPSVLTCLLINGCHS